MKKYRDPDIVPIHHIKMTDIVSMNSTMQGFSVFLLFISDPEDSQCYWRGTCAGSFMFLQMLQ